MNDVKKILFALIAVLGVGFLGYRVLATRHSDKFSKPMLKTPDFKFQDRSGRMVSSDELKGKVWVVDFIFTRCAGSCPILTHQMDILQQAWKGNGDLKLVSMTVDPDHDTPAVLKKYAEEVQADPSQWFFLWAPKKVIYPVIHEFKVTAEPDPEGEPGSEFIHSTRMILIDGQGMMRGLYDGQDDGDMKKLWADVGYLMGSRDHT
ncbi:MAG TPA: SCO family protein [bacterium]|nr:SCO family protein [bacterium]